MNSVVPFSNSALALIRRTVARDCDSAEFDQFIHIAKAVGLDPLRRQIYAFVFGKGGKPEDRKLTVVTGIDGYRAISARAGDYRPADRAPHIEYEPDLKGPSNPLGILRCEVTLHKFAHGEWHPVVGEAYWSEFVPLAPAAEDVSWEDTGEIWADTGKPKKKKVIKPGASMGIDPSKTGWIKSPRNQIAKCAEAQAHRKGWPNDFAGLELQEEVDRRQTVDLTATEIADKIEQEDRFKLIGGNASVIIDWMDGQGLCKVRDGDMYDRAAAFLRTCQGDPKRATSWKEQNRHGLQEFWARCKADALALKKLLEQAEAQRLPPDPQLDLIEAIKAKA